MKRPTMNDIALSLGVSKNAVSLALSGKEGVSEALRRRVIERASELNYAPRESSITRRNLLTLLPMHINYDRMGEYSFFQQVCFHMEAYAKSRGHYLIFSSVSDDEVASLTPPPIMASISFDAILPMGNLPLEYLKLLCTLKKRVVMVDQYYDELPVNCVTTANSSGAYLLTKHLISLGHRQIEFIGKRLTTASINDRWEGYCRAMNDAELPIRRNADQRMRNGHMIMEDVVAGMRSFDGMPTAILCSHDFEARLVIEACRAQGLRVPEDVSVTGFDDIQSHDIIPLNLTTYRTDKYGIARTAIDLYLDEPPSPRKILIYGEPIYRGSTMPPRQD